MDGYCCCKEIKVGGRTARIAVELPDKGWSLSKSGYVIYTSRNRSNGIRRGERAHRLAVSKRAGRELSSVEEVHHQDHDKLNCCPFNLVLVSDGVMNPTGAQRDPYTGQYLSSLGWMLRYGFPEPVPF